MRPLGALLCAPRPSCGTPTSAAQFVSLPPAAPFPAKCRNFLCLNLGGQSTPLMRPLAKVAATEVRGVQALLRPLGELFAREGGEGGVSLAGRRAISGG